jgi:4-amino-4-deoxy-L-arabinose transferase-like glycosyltransferase
MHLGAAAGFMAKSAPGWLVPAAALTAIIIWERRWSELLRWELYAGLLVQALLIGPWIFEVSRTTHGHDALIALFWHNIVGRFIKVAAPAALDYTTGHQSTPGKYLIELPVYLLPWTLLAAAALRRAWDLVSVAGPRGTSWRFAVSAIVPFLLILSIAATARDIYAAPVLPAFGLLIGLWLSELLVGGRPALTTLDRFAVQGTHILVSMIVLAFSAAMALLAWAAPGTSGIHYAINAVAVFAIGVITFLFANQMQRSGDTLRGLSWTYTGYVAAWTLTGLALFPTVDRWQDLPLLAQGIHEDSRNGPLALLDPDETTIAILDHRFRTRFRELSTADVSAEATVSGWFHAAGEKSHVLVKLPGHGAGDLTRLLSRFSLIPPDPGDGVAGTLAKDGVATIVRKYELPEGRRYALLGPPQHSKP